jgi:hypothetical protein
MVTQKQTNTLGDIERDEFWKVCHEILAAVAEYHADLSTRGVLLDFTPAEIRALFSEEMSREHIPAEALLANWRDRVVPRLTAVVGLRALVSKNISLLNGLHNLVREHPDFEVLHEPILYRYSFRYLPNGLATQKEEPEVKTLLDRLNQGIVAAVQRQGSNLVTTTYINGRIAIGMSLCSHGTVAEDVETTFEAIARWGRLLTKAHFVRYEQSEERETVQC